MQTHRKRRLYFILFLITGIGLATGLGLFALRQNINLYYTPEQVFKNKPAENRVLRLGGLVLKGSVHHDSPLLDNQTSKEAHVTFVVTDWHKNITVKYQGILPSLFKEGQGVVAEGKMNKEGIFIADQVLAKHDETYKPPANNS